VDNILYVNRPAGADPAAVTAGIDDVLADLSTVTLKDQAAYTAEESSRYEPVFGIVYALFGLAIVIAVWQPGRVENSVRTRSPLARYRRHES
jgi:putative ABC transport system permease protein